MIGYNFKDKEAFRDQCEEWVKRLHLCTITSKPGSVEEVLKQIANKMHVREGYDLYGDPSEEYEVDQD